METGLTRRQIVAMLGACAAGILFDRFLFDSRFTFSDRAGCWFAWKRNSASTLPPRFNLHYDLPKFAESEGVTVAALYSSFGIAYQDGRRPVVVFGIVEGRMRMATLEDWRSDRNQIALARITDVNASERIADHSLSKIGQKVDFWGLPTTEPQAVAASCQLWLGLWYAISSTLQNGVPAATSVTSL